MSNVLVIAEHAGGQLRKVNWPILTFARQAADILEGEVIVAVIGSGVGDLAQQLSQFAVDKVVTVDDDSLENYLPSEYASAVAGLAEEVDAALVATVASFQGKDFMPRVAAHLGAGMVGDVIAIEEDDEEDGLLYKRPIWSGKLIEVCRATTDVVCATVRNTEFAAMEPSAAGAPVESASPDIDGDGTSFVEFNAVQSERPELTDADVVIAGGRGLKARENFGMLEEMADLFGGAV